MLLLIIERSTNRYAATNRRVYKSLHTSIYTMSSLEPKLSDLLIPVVGPMKYLHRNEHVKTETKEDGINRTAMTIFAYVSGFEIVKLLGVAMVYAARNVDVTAVSQYMPF